MGVKDPSTRTKAEKALFSLRDLWGGVAEHLLCGLSPASLCTHRALALKLAKTLLVPQHPSKRNQLPPLLQGFSPAQKIQDLRLSPNNKMLGAFEQFVFQCWPWSTQYDDMIHFQPEDSALCDLSQLGDALECASEAFVVASVLLCRLCQVPNYVHLFDSPVQAAVAALYVAAKMLYDECRNVPLCAHAIGYSLTELAAVEGKLVDALHWHLFVTAEEFQLYKQHLESLWAQRFISSSASQFNKPVSCTIPSLNCNMNSAIDLDTSADMLTYPSDMSSWIQESTGVRIASPTAPAVLPNSSQTEVSCAPSSFSEFSWLQGPCAQQDQCTEEWSTMINSSSVDFASWSNAVFSSFPPGAL
eukprot:c5491_g1_i1.p1 GENE.c5491_g1_i1~~c5491_g1_i1.p1  ORF type:complete len:359 (-),score=45.00 c5491_g1_i1:430-1506(-)